jgi:hypothetical protein
MEGEGRRDMRMTVGMDGWTQLPVCVSVLLYPGSACFRECRRSSALPRRPLPPSLPPPLPPTHTDPRAYRPHLLEEGSTALEKDWVKDLDLSRAASILPADQAPPKILVLYGSLRSRSYSKLLAFEMARILDLMGADVSGGREGGRKSVGWADVCAGREEGREAGREAECELADVSGGREGRREGGREDECGVGGVEYLSAYSLSHLRCSASIHACCHTGARVRPEGPANEGRRLDRPPQGNNT